MNDSALWTILTVNLGLVTAMMIFGWIVSLVRRNVTIVDSLWGSGFVLLAWATVWQAPVTTVRMVLLAALITVWGVRLTAYLTWRNWGLPEDSRYNQWRQDSGRRFWFVSLGKVFLLQSLFLWVIALVVQIGQLAPAPAGMTPWDWAGVAIWALGMYFETIGDWQLARFKADPASRGQVMNRGLWRYTRHPNYFGEFLIWWGLFLLAIPTGHLWTIVSPVIVSLVLMKMTGVPLTEAGLVNRRPGYRNYIKSTSAFFPWPPKTEAS